MWKWKRRKVFRLEDDPDIVLAAQILLTTYKDTEPPAKLVLLAGETKWNPQR